MEKQSKQGKPERQRVQFDFTPELVAQLDELMGTISAPTRAEVIRNAVKFYAYFAKLDPDATVSVDDADGKNMLRMPVSLIL